MARYNARLSFKPGRPLSITDEQCYRKCMEKIIADMDYDELKKLFNLKPIEIDAEGREIFEANLTL